MISLSDIATTQARIAPFTHRTPVLAAAAMRRPFDLAARNEIPAADVDAIVLMPDDDMLEASRGPWSEFAIAADVSGAASTAALRRWPGHFAGTERVCMLVCGARSNGIGA